MVHSLGKLVQFTAAVAVYLLLSWHCLGVRFCCCCRSFAVLLVMLYRINLVLSAAASIYCWLSWCYSVLALFAAGVVVICWNFWFVLCCVDVPITEAQH
ncbi:hypothetical protein MAM1_0080c04488 [Mucor ambiguus]|uniref:Uncharacterized protein n=1 Tax=Mucor ambiguus TaxID=91626 RepID=A0A0C9LUH2_9FUNG|nr:hypothetical protein MAM1_0080c04488 [Mucor ambiguus]